MTILLYYDKIKMTLKGRRNEKMKNFIEVYKELASYNDFEKWKREYFKNGKYRGREVVGISYLHSSETGKIFVEYITVAPRKRKS